MALRRCHDSWLGGGRYGWLEIVIKRSAFGSRINRALVDSHHSARAAF
jgi:hypothetical protein